VFPPIPPTQSPTRPDYYEARCDAIYPQNKTVKVVSQVPNEMGEYETFLAPYDVLVYAVGATVRACVRGCPLDVMYG